MYNFGEILTKEGLTNQEIGHSLSDLCCRNYITEGICTHEDFIKIEGDTHKRIKVKCDFKTILRSTSTCPHHGIALFWRRVLPSE